MVFIGDIGVQLPANTSTEEFDRTLKRNINASALGGIKCLKLF